MTLYDHGWVDDDNGAGEAGPPGVGFKLTASGNYDIQNKRLENVAQPLKDSDATTKKYVDDIFKSDINVHGKKVTNVEVMGSDAVTKTYLESNFMKRSNNKWNAAKSVISNVHSPQSDGDAVNQKYFEDRFENTGIKFTAFVQGEVKKESERLTNLVQSNKFNYDCDNNRLINVGKPEHENDAVNLKFIKDNCITKRRERDGYLSVNKVRLTDLSEPSKSHSAVTKNYADNLHNEQAVRITELDREIKTLAEMVDRHDKTIPIVIENKSKKE